MTENNRYIIIGRSSCPFCVMATDFCAASHLPHVFLDCEGKGEIEGDYKSFYQHPTVPIILANNLETGYTKKVGGYTELLDFIT